VTQALQLAREFLAGQFDADGHTTYLADSSTETTARLCAHAIDVVLLGDFQSPARTRALLRLLRAGQLHTRVHPAQPVLTLGDPGETATVRAYEWVETTRGYLHHTRDELERTMRPPSAASST